MCKINWILSLILALGCGAPAFSQVNPIFQEDFTNTTYQNYSHTTADWSTADGEIRLNPFSLGDPTTIDTPGSSRDITISGDYAYVADYTNGLVVLDISNPEQPVQVAHYNSPGNATGVAVSGNILCLADGSAGVHIIDITTPTAPVVLGNYDPTGSAYDVVIDGNMAYLANYTGGLRVIDISDPANPTQHASFTDISATIGLDIDGDLLYIVDYYNGLHILDITNHASITQIGYFNTVGNSLNVTVEGNLAYVADGVGGLLVFDVTAPTSPLLLNTLDTGGNTRSVAIVGDYAFVADFNDGMLLLDITDPLAIEVISIINTSPAGYQVAVDGDKAFLAAGSSGVSIYSAASIIPMTFVGGIQDDFLSYPTIVGNYAYCASSYRGLQILNISNPENPIFVGEYYDPYYSWNTTDVEIVGNYAYIADQIQGFMVLDITSPSSPIRVYHSPIGCHSVAIDENMIYVTRYSDGYHAYDISDPTAPFYVSGVSMAGYFRTITTDGDQIYMTMENAGVRIVEFNKGSGVFQDVGTVDTDYALDLVIKGDHAYVADYGYGIKVLDISNPAAPLEAVSFATQNAAISVCFEGDNLFVGGGLGVERIDISNPTNPTSMDFYDAGYHVYGVVVSGDYIFVGTSYYGMEVAGVFQRKFDPINNQAESYIFAAPEMDAVQARFTTTQVDDVAWEFSADNGTQWQTIARDGLWNNLIQPGNQLVWRSTLGVNKPKQNPSCSDLQIEWLYSSPTIVSIEDVPGDQGRQISLTWQRSGYDFLESSSPILEYSVYRKIEGSKATIDESEAEKDYPPGDWHFVMTVPADTEENYAVVVPTLGDSTVTNGQYYSTFFIRARTATPGVYFDAAAVSGYSVDNLAPSVPSGFKILGSEQLVWDEITDGDFRYFTVYGCDNPTLDETAVVIGQTTGLSLNVAGQSPAYFLLTATDFSGNESQATGLDVVSGSLDSSLPSHFALNGNHPNPFNPSTLISFDLAADVPVRLTVFDVSGRMVRTLLDGGLMTAGRHDERWDGTDYNGHTAAAGIYLYHLEAGDFRETRRMTLIK